MTRFFVIFVLLLVALFAVEILDVVQQHVILPFTTAIAHLAVAIMQPFDAGVVATSNEMRRGIGGPGISIVAGCSGVEAVLILVSAVLAFPAPWKHKLIGAVIGFFAIQLLNLVRIISLFYLHEWNQMWFEWFHLYLWQALIILDALVFWLIWLRYLPREPEPAAA